LQIKDLSIMIMEPVVQDHLSSQGARGRHLDSQQVDSHLRQPATNFMNSSSGISSIPTSLIKPSHVQAQVVDDESLCENTDPTSSFFSGEKPQILSSTTSGLEEDTSGISGISPLEDPSSEPHDCGGGRGGGASGKEFGEVNGFKNTRISFEPPTSSSEQNEATDSSIAFWKTFPASWSLVVWDANIVFPLFMDGEVDLPRVQAKIQRCEIVSL